MSALEAAPALTLKLLSVNDMPHLWPEVRPLLENACAYVEDMTPEGVLSAIGLNEEGVETMKLLALMDGPHVHSLMGVSLVRRGGETTLDCNLVSGRDFADWLPFEPTMDAWARSLGCGKVRIAKGRKGWLKMLAHWKKIGEYVVLERDL